MNPQVIQKIKTAPRDPGVYIFYQGRTPLYIGKASNLKNRLQNYLKITDWKNEVLHQEADRLKLVKLRSNIEALITESQLIKTLKPKLNTLWKDDKNYFYVAITREKFPRIFITHQPYKIRNSNIETRNKSKIQNPNDKNVSDFEFRASNLDCIGPFTDGQSIKAVLRLLRKSFPYCACFQPHLRLCLNAQIGNCLGYCCNQNLKATQAQISKYKNNVRKIKNILAGKDKKFIAKLKDPYELLVLEKIWQHEPYLDKIPNYKLQNPNKLQNQNDKNVSDFGFRASDFSRIECYDNSHLSGKEAVGAMTAWKKTELGWIADKNSWRKFKIQGQYTEDDPRMMSEMLTRRFNHSEWLYPDLVIIDGGITQFNAAKTALGKSQITNYKLQTLKVISFAKPKKLVYGWGKYPLPLNQLPPELQKILELAIAQTHNFVRRYHRRVRQKSFLNL
ncbi:MAG: GIY-YIG nuclease family protein [bacterium]|nr:GIY-YIG nuclease family protein [bacterium]